MLCLLSVSAECPAPFTVTNPGAPIPDTIAEIEGYTKGLSNAFATAFSGRCSDMGNCECSPWYCSDSVGDTECSTHGGAKRPELCSGTSTCDGVKVNFDQSAAYWVGENEPTQAQKELLCGTKEVDAEFKRIAGALDGMLYLYFGGYNGAYREYPAKINECGRAYDPRIRPWYRAGSSGPKDVVVLVDISGSMDTRTRGKSRLELVKDSLGVGDGFGLLDSFGHSDFVSVVAFSSDASVVGDQELLVRGTTENLQDLKDSVRLLVERTTTNFRAGFEKAFEVLRESAAQERSSNCKRVIIFLTDGEDSDCNISPDGGECGSTSNGESLVEDNACRCQQAYLDQIDTWQDEMGGARASIFSYSMGADAGNSLPRQIACRNGGSWGEISDGSDPLSQMQSFFTFLAKDAQPDTVYWSEPFADWSTGEMLSTAVSPVLHRGNLVGVAAIDVTPQVLGSQVGDSQAMAALSVQLQARSTRCNNQQLSISQCELQMMRMGVGEVDRQMTCPAALSSSAACCFAAPASASSGSKKYRIVDQPRSWDDAKSWCESNGGRLARVASSDEEGLHMLAGIAPPDGAWVGLQRSGAAWAFEGGEAVPGSDALWAPGHPLAANEAGFLSPSGSTGNAYTARKSEARSFLCEFLDSAPCPRDNCTRSDAAAEISAADYSASPGAVRSATQCQVLTETFVRPCPAGTAGPTPTCQPKSTRPWADRGQNLCCPIRGAGDSAGGGGDGGDGSDFPIGAVAGGVGAGVVLVGLGSWFLLRRGKPSAPAVAARPPAPMASGPPMPMDPYRPPAANPVSEDGYKVQPLRPPAANPHSGEAVPPPPYSDSTLNVMEMGVEPPPYESLPRP